MLKVKLPDGSVREYNNRVRPIDVAADIGPGLAKATIAAEVDGQTVDSVTPLPSDGEVSLRLLTKKDPEALRIMRHSCAHVMARAVMRLFDGVQLAFGPTTDKGFYYDMKLPRSLTEADFPAIEAEMARLIKADEPFERIDEPRQKALEICRELGQEFKVEHIQEGLAERIVAVVLSAGRVHRSLPRPAHSLGRRHRRVQAAERRRGVLERGPIPRSSCSGSTPPPGSASRTWKNI